MHLIAHNDEKGFLLAIGGDLDGALKAAGEYFKPAECFRYGAGSRFSIAHDDFTQHHCQTVGDIPRDDKKIWLGGAGGTCRVIWWPFPHFLFAVHESGYYRKYLIVETQLKIDNTLGAKIVNQYCPDWTKWTVSDPYLTLYNAVNNINEKLGLGLTRTEASWRRFVVKHDRYVEENSIDTRWIREQGDAQLWEMNIAKANLDQEDRLKTDPAAQKYYHKGLDAYHFMIHRFCDVCREDSAIRYCEHRSTYSQIWDAHVDTIECWVGDNDDKERLEVPVYCSCGTSMRNHVLSCGDRLRSAVLKDFRDCKMTEGKLRSLAGTDQDLPVTLVAKEVPRAWCDGCGRELFGKPCPACARFRAAVALARKTLRW